LCPVTVLTLLLFLSLKPALSFTFKIIRLEVFIDLSENDGSEPYGSITQYSFSKIFS
jgi:hypothetical protein